MKASEIREKYLKFFEKRGHKRISPAPLVLENDPTTLFTSSGMQPLVPYLMGQEHPEGRRLVDSQPSIRLQDIEEVGDNRHTTFFEMLGNWSLGDYFKKEQLAWIYEFLTEELNLPKDKFWVTVFEGNNQVPKDLESIEIWKSLGVPEERIKQYGVKKNWWSRSGTPEEMPVGEIGGPDSEMFFEFDSVKHDPKFGESCHPNCDCGRFIELGNSVFIQYIKQEDGTLKELPNKNVDYGGGLERIAAAVLGSPDVFMTDLFLPTIKILEKTYGVDYGSSEDSDKSLRIIAEHLRGASALISMGVIPGNKGQGYILRRLLRRTVLHARLINKKSDLRLPEVDFSGYGIPIEFKQKNEINDIIQEETQKFAKALERGMKKLLKVTSSGEKVTANIAFDLYQTEGFPLEVTIETLENSGQDFSEDEKKKFSEEFEKHKEKSRSASAGMFKGGLADHSVETTRLHTATHLLNESLRRVLGEHVSQKGSNITAERLRFDFSHPQKLTEEEIKKVEDLINEQVDKDLPVKMETKTFKEAQDEGALAFFGEKYGERVNVYSIGDFSKEVCGGPHVDKTSEVGRVRIIKQERIGSGLVRVYASVQNEHS